MTSLANIRKQAQRGFTLVELLIVVIILAILAAIVVPQFSSSTNDAKLAALDSNLANLRTAVALYYQQHGHYPGAATAKGTCPVGTAPASGTVNTPEAAIAQLTMYTNAAGLACSGTNTDFKFGPYLKSIPADPILNKSDVAVPATADVGNLTMAASTATGGWLYDYVTGKIITNNNTAIPGVTPATTYDKR